MTKRVFSVAAVAATVSAVTVLGGAAVIGAVPAEARAAKCSTSHLPLPDQSCTPGATNPDVRQDNINQTICKPGWTKTIRPPLSYTNQLKQQGIEDYGYSDKNLSSYEEDHLLPLELGGAPKDPRNLWPEPYAGEDNAHSKDKVENHVKTAVCNGEVSLQNAQNAVMTNWMTAEKVLGIGR